MDRTLITPIMRKEFIQILRDPRSLAVAILIPIFMLVLFGYAITFDIRQITLAVLDQDGSFQSREFLRSLTASPIFKADRYLSNYEEIDGLLDRSLVRMGVVIPPGFSRALKRGESAPVQFLVDGTDANFAAVCIGYLTAACYHYSLSLTVKYLRNRGLGYLARTFSPISTKPRIWFNQTLRSENFIVPGIIAVILMMLAAQITSLSVAREYERGTIEQLIVSPIRSSELIVGKLLPYICIGFCQVGLVTLVGTLHFGVPFRGSLLLFAILTVIFLVGAMGIGMLFSIITKSQQVAMQISLLSTMLPALLLSGFIFPIESMPKVLQAITYLVPARYFLVILRGIFLKGSGINVLWPEVLWLSVFTIALLFLCFRSFKKTLD
ncbi:MAG: ABC transporter permease [Deltaproteobacteria bacterium]|nr:MAG: ABC transporter permease [Deltaproteobacteria bacterium]